MLSAVAARKAAQAQITAAVVADANISPGPSSRSPRSSEKSTAKKNKPAINSASKGRAVASDETSGSSKRKRGVKTRYFDPQSEPQPVQGDGDVDMDAPLDSGDYSSIQIIRSQRAWSPSMPMGMDEDDSPPNEEEDSRDDAAGPSLPLPKLTTWTPSQTNIYDLSSTSRLLLLRPTETITLVGTFTLRVIRGKVSYQGTTLSSRHGSLNIFAPRCSPLGRIEALHSSSHEQPTEIVPDHLKQVLQGWTKGAAIVLSELVSGVEVIGKVFPAFKDVFSLPVNSGGSDERLNWRTAAIASQDHPSLHPHFIPPSWDQALNSAIAPISDSTLLRAPVYLTRGPKGVGKSSFSQLLVNRLLSRYEKVALLDTDPGQPIFSPPSLLSLHVLASPILTSASFANIRVPDKAHFLGSVNLRSCSERWTECVEDLVREWRESWSFTAEFEGLSSRSNGDEGEDRIKGIVPLVINTPGWTKGYGSLLLRQFTHISEPGCIFVFPEPLNSDPFLPPAFSQGEDITPPESDAKIYNLEPISHSQSSMALAARWSSADWRVAGMLSYLQCSLPSAPSDERCARWISSHSLVSIPPWSVSYKSGEEEGAIDAVHLVGAWAGDVVAEEIERVLDCSLVGLVSSIAQPDSAAASTSASPIPYTQAIPPPSPGQSTCYGLALIRAIDATTQSFHILTPLPPSTLSKCRVLIKGEIDLPVWGFLDFGKEPAASASAGEKEKDVKAPYLDWGSSKGIVGAEKRRVRRNVMRKGQM